MAYNKTWPQSSSLKRSIARRLARKRLEASEKALEGGSSGNPVGMYLVEYIPPQERIVDVWKGYDR